MRGDAAGAWGAGEAVVVGRGVLVELSRRGGCGERGEDSPRKGSQSRAAAAGRRRGEGLPGGGRKVTGRRRSWGRVEIGARRKGARCRRPWKEGLGFIRKP